MSFSLLRRAGFSRSAGIYCNVCGWISEKGAAGRRMMSALNNSWSPVLMVSSSLNDSGSLMYNFHGRGEESDELLLPDNIKHVEFAGSSHGWLALYNWVNDDVFLSNPITSRHIKLPPLHTLPEPKIINLQGGVSRVALSCSPDDGSEVCRAMMTVGRASRLAFCVPGRSTGWTPIGDLYCERLRWDDFDNESRETGMREYEDVVYSSRRKLFFCITRFTTELEGWNVGDPLSPRIDWRVPHNDELKFERPDYPWPSLLSGKFNKALKKECWHLKYLVFAEQSDELFLVVRHVNPRTSTGGSFFEERIYYSKFRGCDYSFPYKTIAFDVYKIDQEGKLRYMECSLEGMAMFVGINHSYAEPASEFPALKPNTIYFADENHLMRLSKSDVHNLYGGHDNGIFDYKNKICTSCCGGCPLDASSVHDQVESFDPPPLWFFQPNTKYLLGSD